MTTTVHPETGRDLRDRALATTALALYSFTVALGFSRVFSGWEFLADLVPIVVVGHLAGVALARSHLAIAFPVQLAVVAWVVGLVGYGDTYRFGLPTGETIDIMRADISFAGDQFPDAVAPVVYAGGWTALATLGIGIAVLLADLFAFRAAARFEALVPGGVLFVVVGALGSGRDRVLTTIVLILAAVLTVGALRSLQRRPARIVIGKQAPRRLRMVAAALVLGSITALVAGIVGPRLPGAASDAVWDTSRGGTDVTRIESPLVDIRSRLVDQSTSEMFRVQSNAESYWRLATLPSFDGSRWKLDRSDLTPTDELTRHGPSNRLQITQEIEIGGLRGQLVPAAPEPVEADGSDLRWSARNSTLLVADPDGVQSGDVISAVSSAPRYYPGQLDRATASNPPGSIDYLALPDGLPDSVTELAGDVTAGATTPYQRARAIQDWFRSEFEYSLEVQSGHGNNAIEAFLRLRVGYCEQFAGTFAAMARSVGLPARVAVGYTSGTYLEESGTYSVAGRNAHAWPEVWFDDLGWVAFEPTPGRGAPGNEPYTGVEAQQDLGSGPPEPGPPSQDGGGPAPTTTTQAPPSSGPPAGGNQPDEVPDLEGGGGPTGASTPTSGGPSRDLSRAATPALILLLILGAVALAPAAIRRVRKRHLGVDPASAIVGIYSRLQGLAAAAGAPTSSAATPHEFSKRAAQAVPGVRNDFTKLTDAVTASAFGPSDAVDERTVEQCEAWYANIEEVAKSLLPWHVRLRRYLTLR